MRIRVKYGRGGGEKLKRLRKTIEYNCYRFWLILAFLNEKISSAGELNEQALKPLNWSH